MPEKKINESNFQTPPALCDHMALLVPPGVKTILEPTPGAGNLAAVVKQRNGKTKVIQPENYWNWQKREVDCIVMNPPFLKSEWNLDGASDQIKQLQGKKLTYAFIYEMMDLSDNIIGIIPWDFFINSAIRANKIFSFGLRSVTNLGRNVFPGSRITPCLIHMEKGYTKQPIFKNYLLKRTVR